MRVLVAGDVHGDANHALFLFDKAKRFDCDVIVQCGDFGFWPRWRDGKFFLEYVSRKSEEFGIPFFWIDGNHEDHDALDDLVPMDCRSGVQILPGLTYLPRGTVWEWDGVTFGAMGGAYSIDKGWRDPGYDWFPQEVIQEHDIERAQEAGPVDVMFTHDSPLGVNMATHLGRPIAPSMGSLANREMLQRVIETWTPKVLVHGHWHVQYTDRVDGTKVIGLAHNSKMGRSWTVIDTEDFHG